MKEIPIRSYAHIGDAVYEVFIREKTVLRTSKPQDIHKMTVMLVNAQFQADILEKIEPFLTEEERDIIRRARNQKVTTARRTNQAIHRQSTAFEALIGFLYMKDKSRLCEVYDKLEPFIEEEIQKI